MPINSINRGVDGAPRDSQKTCKGRAESMKAVTTLAPELAGSWMCRVADRCGVEAALVLQPLVSSIGRWLSFEVMSCSHWAVLGRVEKGRAWINEKTPACFIRW